MKRRILIRSIAVLSAAALLASGCGGKQARESGGGGGEGAKGGRLTIATGNTTGVYYQLGGGLGRVISQNLKGYQATASETGASVQNIQGTVQGKYDIAFSLADSAKDAVEGKHSFTEPQPVEALLRLYPNITHVAVRADSGIKTVADMKGKAVSTGSPKSGTEVIANRLLETAGIDPAKDVKAQRLGLPESVDEMQDGKIDALFWSGGLPTGGMTDLTTAMKSKVRFLDLTPMLPKLQAKYGADIYSAAPIPKATYQQPADVGSIAVPNVLLVKKGFDAELAEKLVTLIFEHKAELVKVNAAAEDIEPATAPKTDPIPLNPGAKKALDGLGG